MQTKIGKMYMSQIIAQTRNIDGSGANGDKKLGMFRGPHKPLDEVTCYKVLTHQKLRFTRKSNISNKQFVSLHFPNPILQDFLCICFFLCTN